MMELINKTEGVIYGQAIGDAMGMPPELWSRTKLKKEYTWIDDFLDGNSENTISYQYKKGQFTDDTAQALIILDSLIANDFSIDRKDIALRLVDWAVKEDAFQKNILGPTSKNVLQCYIDGIDPGVYTRAADTNGGAMRSSPLGSLFTRNQKKQLCDFVSSITMTTHSSDIALASACMPAMAVASFMDGASRDEMIKDVMEIEAYARSLGSDTPAPMISARLDWGIETAQKYSNDPEHFLDSVYNVIGTGHYASETAPAAIAIAYYAMDVKKAAVLCANLGGDTDTIGAIACAICGAIEGKTGIPKDYVELIDNANGTDFNRYALALAKKRGKIEL